MYLHSIIANEFREELESNEMKKNNLQCSFVSKVKKKENTVSELCSDIQDDKSPFFQLLENFNMQCNYIMHPTHSNSILFGTVSTCIGCRPVFLVKLN